MVVTKGEGSAVMMNIIHYSSRRYLFRSSIRIFFTGRVGNKHIQTSEPQNLRKKLLVSQARKAVAAVANRKSQIAKLPLQKREAPALLWCV